jgi:hypothetical protein
MTPIHAQKEKKSWGNETQKMVKNELLSPIFLSIVPIIYLTINLPN